MRFFYNVLFALFFWAATPFYFWKMWRRGDWRKGFGQRFAKYDAKLKTAITNRHMLWIHAVSVGEVNVATQLIHALEQRVPNIKILVSTTTSTGMGELRKKLPSHIQKIYYPIDRPRYVNRALRILTPEAIVLVEAEIWPNFLWQAKAKNIPLFLVNARLSERSYRGYKRFGLLFRNIFASFTGVGAQNEADAERLRKLGCRPEAVRVVGNLKFDAVRLSERLPVNIHALLRQIGVGEDALIIVGGSTHAGEEAILASQFLKLRGQFPKLFLILVPRHFERGREVGKMLEEKKIPFVYRTELAATSSFAPGEINCLLVNTTGELRHVYEAATVIFVGKSLSAEGGQNPIEPGALGKAMVFGPNMQNFLPIAASFVQHEGAIQVRDEAGLEGALRQLLQDEPKRQRLGANALQVVRENQGAIDRTVEMIVKHLPDDEMYIASGK